MSNPLLIADVPWLVYRSFFALPKSIKGADGRPVNALLGTVNALLLALEVHPARAVVACFGAEQADYRVQLYPPYHAHRDPTPDELAEQWALAPGLLASFGWTISDSEDLEADDAMGSYARAESSAGGNALLLSADRDMYQAVTERVSVLELGKGGIVTTLGVQDVIERYGVTPEQVPDFIALRGDPSDGLPGAPGIGAKTAGELLRTHGTLERLLEAAAKAVEGEESGLRPRAVAALHENAALLLDFKRIATFVLSDVQRPADRPSDFTAGASAARELGMRQLAERLETPASTA